MNKQIKSFEQLKDSRLLYEKKMPNFGNILLSIITLLLLIVLLWSIKTSKTYIIKSNGIVQSVNKNYSMSPFTGEILEIHIKEGDYVKKGDQLLTVKSMELDLKQLELEEQLEQFELQLNGYNRLVKSYQSDNNLFDSKKEEDILYYSQFEAYKSQVNQSQVDVNALKTYGYTDEQIKAELVKNKSKITELYHEAIQKAQGTIQEIKTQIASIKSQLNAVTTGQSNYIIAANETGYIHMLSSYKQGMVVQAATPIASISSKQDKYEIIGNISTADRARIQVGNRVDLVIDGLAQTIYGSISGTVEDIDSDMTISENNNSNQPNSYFKIYIKPDVDYLINKEGNKINLTNGMSVEARIIYDEISYFNYVLESLGVKSR